MLFRIVAVLLVTCPFLQSQTTPKIGQAAPDFTLIDANGSPVKLSGLKGKVVLLDFWAMWCTGCKVEIPWYVEFESKYGKDGLATVGVSMDDDCWKRPSDCTKPRRLGIVASVAISSDVGLDSRAAYHRGIRETKARRTVPAASGPTEFTSPYQGSAALFSQGGSSSHSALGIR